MNKTEAQQRLTAIESEVKKLREIIEAPEVTDINGVFNPPVTETFYTLAQSSVDGMYVVLSDRNHSGLVKNVFKNYDAAKEWANALNVLMELSTCKGRIKATDRTQYAICNTSNGEITCETRNFLSHKMLGAYKSSVDGRNAINKVGAKRIQKAIETIVGV